MTLPPFERFYDEHREEIYAFLVRRLGRDRAEDAFQETFLRALRAYPKLRHGEHLRAWAYTIASRIAIDEHRRPRADADLPELATLDGRPAFADGNLTFKMDIFNVFNDHAATSVWERGENRAGLADHGSDLAVARRRG